MFSVIRTKRANEVKKKAVLNFKLAHDTKAKLDRGNLTQE